MPRDWEPTRATLHAYALAASAIPRGLLERDPRWWFLAFTVTSDGLRTLPIPLPDGGEAIVRLDLRGHQVALDTNRGFRRTWAMDAGQTATELADELIAGAAELGLHGHYERGPFDDDDPRPYDREDAEAFLAVLQAVHQVFAVHRARLDGQVSPIHMWPHGFDLSFEWFGTKMNSYEENGKTVELPSQLNLGFYPGGDAYFYSNPWPFDPEVLIDSPLPAESEWNVEDWHGTRLRYAVLEGDPRATERLLEFAGRVFEIVRPTLIG
jgi:Family of unknown function (DUF5996)